MAYMDEYFFVHNTFRHHLSSDSTAYHIPLHRNTVLAFFISCSIVSKALVKDTDCCSISFFVNRIPNISAAIFWKQRLI